MYNRQKAKLSSVSSVFVFSVWVWLMWFLLEPSDVVSLGNCLLEH